MTSVSGRALKLPHLLNRLHGARGVYILTFDDKTLFIGASNNLGERIENHLDYWPDPITQIDYAKTDSDLAAILFWLIQTKTMPTKPSHLRNPDIGIFPRITDPPFASSNTLADFLNQDRLECERFITRLQLAKKRINDRKLKTIPDITQEALDIIATFLATLFPASIISEGYLWTAERLRPSSHPADLRIHIGTLPILKIKRQPQQDGSSELLWSLTTNLPLPIEQALTIDEYDRRGNHQLRIIGLGLTGMITVCRHPKNQESLQEWFRQLALSGPTRWKSQHSNRFADRIYLRIKEILDQQVPI